MEYLMRPSRAGVLLAGMLLASAAAAKAHEVPIETTTEFRVESGKVAERAITLVFDDEHLLIRNRQSKEELFKLVYTEITSIAYENATQPKALGSLAAPASEEPRHWLTFHYQQEGKAGFLLLSLDRYDYDSILRATALLTGKSVEGAPEE
jgi:hypothetical protein